MNVPELVGLVAVEILREELSADGASAAHGTLRFVLNLSAEHTAAVARVILADADLWDQIDIKIPSEYVSDYALPSEVLTTLPATYFRDAECAKQLLLLAEVDYNEEASFHEVSHLGSSELLERLDVWVRLASDGLFLRGDHARWWEKALTGLRDLRAVSLDRFATYVLRTRNCIVIDGYPLPAALGAALPALRLPRDESHFLAVKEKSRGFVSAWKNLFTAAQKRGGLLLKQAPSQILLSEEDLRAAFERVRDVIPDSRHQAVLRFISAPSGWNPAAADLAECEWEEIRPLFDGLRREKFNLGQGTMEFYDEGEPGLLSEDDREYLRVLGGRRTTEPNEDDVVFYEEHRGELKEDRKLRSAWDRFVFGRPIETNDLLFGIAAALEPLIMRAPVGSARKLRIRCDHATRRDLRELNVEAGLYFAHRYAGLRRLFGSRVTWDVGELFDFARLLEIWHEAGKALNHSTSKAALRLRFVLELETEIAKGSVQSCSAQVVWHFDQDSITSQCADDWGRLAKHPFIRCRTERELSLIGGRARAVDLSDVRTFVPAYDRDRGSFVPTYKAERDLAVQWRRSLNECRDRGYLASAVAEDLEARFSEFETTYTNVLRGFAEHGAANAETLRQVAAYTALLQGVVSLAKGDRNRDWLLKPLLQIGVVPVDGGGAAAVVAPWHPLRLVAMWRKAKVVGDLVRRLLGPEEVSFGDTRLFFRDLQQDLLHPLYPELTAVWTEDGAQLLSVSDVLSDYSLHESPVALPLRSDDTNESPAEGSECVLDLVRRYLALHPHERANMSVVLFNCDSARLPTAVVEKIGSIQDDEEDVRCQVLLRHVDSERLRGVYRDILSVDSSVDTYNPSEATTDFMARLRISVVADQAPPPDPRDGCPYDIVFSQDVISRHGRVEWYSEKADAADLGTLLPSRWSRRRPAPADDLKSSVYLACPVQSIEGWDYLTALATLFKGDWDGVQDRRLIPVKQLDFRDARTARIFQETHDLGNWVVNFDELLDRRQLLNQDVRVIRYKQAATQGRNVIISSRAPLGPLRAMLLQRLRDLQMDLGERELRALADHLIEDANDVSGDIVLRAARRGESASELLGVVLSRRMIRDEIGADRITGWYFLDDYAAWMGQREEQLADLLALSPTVQDGVLRVTMALAEAKYVDLSCLSVKKKESQKQLRDTMRRLEEAVFGEPARLDRDSWLARISDLLLDGIRVPAASGIDVTEWRRALREGRCEVDLKGVSHVFVPTAGDSRSCGEVMEVPGVANAFQEVYGRTELKRLLEAYAAGESTLTQRRALGAEHLSKPALWRKPGSGDVRAPRRIRRVRPDPIVRDAEGGEPEGSGETTAATGGVQKPEPAVKHTGWATEEIPVLVANTVASPEEATDREWLKSVSTGTKSALQQLGFQARLIDSKLTPNSALLRFAGSASITVDQVARRRSELLTTFGLNIISVRPEPGAVVVSVERAHREVVSVQTLWARWHPGTEDWGNEELLIGVRESDGTLLVLSPGRLHAPHTLVAGSTGSGKSVLLQNLLLGIAATNTPAQARIVLIDPKQGVDYFLFEGLPHLHGGIIVTQETARDRLEALVAEMDARYVQFRKERVPNLAAYNSKVPPGDRLPAVWLVHDEFAEWMLTETYRDNVAAAVQRLGVKARAAGIYLVFAAQRPDANVMPMQLRANLGNRLILRVDSEGTSEIALGEKGAERLLGRGHMVAKLEGERDLCFAQVPFVPPAFAEAVLSALRGSAGSAVRG